jgi:hypothetical protein
MTTHEHNRPAEFTDRGYTIVRGVLDGDEIAHLREVCAEHLTASGEEEMCGSAFLAIRELAEIPLRDRIVSAVRELVGDPVVLYPNFTVRKNVYVPWHVDAAVVGPGHQYVWEPSFIHLQAGLYLQDNDPVAGGGIDAVHGSHLMSFDGYGTVDPNFEPAAWTLGTSCLRETIDTRAGDLVLWHSRLMHASTPVVQAAGREKYGVFFSYGRLDVRYNSEFLCTLVANRVRTMNGTTRLIPRLAEIAHFRYPDSFPEWFVKDVEAGGIKVPVL